MRVVAYVPDLLFRSRIDGAARAGGRSVLYPRAGQPPPDLAGALVLVDLGARGVDARAVIAEARAQGAARIVAFGSHVDGEGLERARQAGADDVLPRSAFVRLLPELLGGGRAA